MYIFALITLFKSYIKGVLKRKHNSNISTATIWKDRNFLLKKFFVGLIFSGDQLPLLEMNSTECLEYVYILEPFYIKIYLAYEDGLSYNLIALRPLEFHLNGLQIIR